MHAPRFSIIIPTRNRAETLRCSLRTCTGQDYDDYEIIVHDNCSDPATRQAVEEEQNGKVRYFRSEEPLAMAESWERALSFAEGEYLLVLGDDDALLPHALKLLDRMLRELSVDLIRWACASYIWPNHNLIEKRNTLAVPLSNTGFVLRGSDVIRMVIKYQVGHEALPMLYNAVAHRRLIDEMKRRAGRMFLSGVPDVASGFALAYLAKHYVSVQFPLSIAGSSGRSNSGGNKSAHEEFVNFNQKAGRNVHPSLPNVFFQPIAIADAFLHVKEALFKTNRDLSLNRRGFLSSVLGYLWILSPAESKEVVDSLLASMADDPKLRTWFQRELAHPSLAPKSLTTARFGFDELRSSITIKASDCGVHDVHGAAQLCETILCFSQPHFNYTIKNPRATYTERFRSGIRTLVKGTGPSFWY